MFIINFISFKNPKGILVKKYAVNKTIWYEEYCCGLHERILFSRDFWETKVRCLSWNSRSLNFLSVKNIALYSLKALKQSVISLTIICIYDKVNCTRRLLIALIFDRESTISLLLLIYTSLVYLVIFLYAIPAFFCMVSCIITTQLNYLIFQRNLTQFINRVL